MKIVQCSNGHFFDGDSYSVCPHCGASVGPSTTNDISEKKSKRRVFFHNKDKNNEDLSYQSVKQNNDQFVYNPQSEELQNTSANTGCYENNDTPTVPLFEINNDIDALEADDDATVVLAFEQFSEETQYVQEKEQTPSTRESSLQNAVKQASANSEGKTMSYFSAVTAEINEERASAEDYTTTPLDPVVGWLVCVGGVHFGEAFNIKSGMNSIGRNLTNKIVLNRDNSVSREKHAFITYEPKHRQFYVKPGDSSGLTYVNDEYITETKRINAKDIIELGNSRFIFIPLCAESFSWEDYMKG